MKILLIIFLVLMVSHKVLTKRLVENTTCLGLVKPSNQQLRLTCSNPSDYHCLLDETFTREFEVCREWKWIPGGKCAYFNTYGNGNVDERECKPGINLTCSESNQQFESYKNTQFTACYKKKPIVTSIFTTTSTSIQVTSNWTTNGDVETPSTSNIWTVLPTVFGIIVPFLSVSLTCVICMRFKSTKKDNTLEGQKGDEEKLSMHTESDESEFYDVSEVLSTDRKSSVKEKIDDNSEKRPLLEKHADDSLKNSLTIRRGNKDNTPEEQKEDEEKAPKNTTDSDSIKSDVEKEKTKDSTDEFNEVHKNCPKEYIPEGQKWDKEKASKNTEGSDNIKTDVEEEKTKDSTDELNEVDKNCPKDNTLEGQKGDEEKLRMLTERDEFCEVSEVLSTDNTPEEQKEDEEKASKNTTGSDNIKSDVEKEKTKDSTDEFNGVDKNCPKEYIHEGQKWNKEKASKNTEGSDNIKTDVQEEKTKDSTDDLNEVDKNCPKGVEDSEHLDNTGSLENCKNDVSSQPNTINEDFKLSPGKLKECRTDKSSDNGTENGMSEVLNNTVGSLKSTESTTDNTLEGQKGDEEKPSNSSAVSDPVRSDTEEEKEDEFYPAEENLPAVGTDKRRIEDKEKSSVESKSGSAFHPGKSDDEEENEKESTDVFDDTFETLSKIVPPTDENDRKEFTDIYHLLNVEGVNLSKKVMTATIKKKTTKSVRTLINNLTDQEKNKLKEVLPKEFSRILESKEERETSFLVLYGLHLNYLDEEFCPKSGWGNPVRGKDIGIGDDVDRLYRIQTIVGEISEPATVSIKSYIRLLDIMLPSLTRLDFNAEFMDNLKAFEKDIKCFKKQH